MERASSGGGRHTGSRRSSRARRRACCSRPRRSSRASAAATSRTATRPRSCASGARTGPAGRAGTRWTRQRRAALGRVGSRRCWLDPAGRASVARHPEALVVFAARSGAAARRCRPSCRRAAAAAGAHLGGRHGAVGERRAAGRRRALAVHQGRSGSAGRPDGGQPRGGTLGSGGGTRKCGPGSTNCFSFQAPASYARVFGRAGFDLMNVARQPRLRLRRGAGSAQTARRARRRHRIAPHRTARADHRDRAE